MQQDSVFLLLYIVSAFFYLAGIVMHRDFFCYKGRIDGYEIKAGSTYSPDYFKNLKHWSMLTNTKEDFCKIIYTGETTMQTQYGELAAWGKLEM
ncbi:hypothetical protein [Treponema sp.]|uniref:hypothetical protein n=1 Tax=Treponema sp. TaxID=166 RepID=UPI003EFCD29E